MTSQRHNKKEGSLKDLFAKIPVKKVLPGELPVMEGGDAVDRGVLGDGETPLTRSFMEQLFGALRGDFAKLGMHGSRRSNIRIKGVPLQAITGKLEDFVVRLFHHMAPDLKDQTVVLDRTHRGGHPVHLPGQDQDILTCLYHYKQRETIMEAVRDQSLRDFECFRIGLFQDLSTLTLQRRRTL
ncbi:hypothetical protein NDU88_009795 [Pleurodeles waltl]|uniref:Uncharacterized protein n=1 Tax=Pleurodeles waltl TaxID=8319 RepID=A0AAV7RYM4_PLEWA|nr:hypothetical protein NDU88_009795 [Pleurodeles waltl]